MARPIKTKRDLALDSRMLSRLADGIKGDTRIAEDERLRMSAAAMSLAEDVLGAATKIRRAEGAEAAMSEPGKPRAAKA